MKAHEMAALTQESIEKKMKERPKEVFNDLINKMKSQAREGQNHINFMFSDDESIVAEVRLMLEDEGYQVSKGERGLTKISWAKAAAPKTCGFSIAWVGTCKQPAGAEGVCDEHRKVKCRCGRQAIRECDTTMGPFVCGFPTCGRCTHSH